MLIHVFFRLEKDPWTEGSSSSKGMSASQMPAMENAIERRVRDIIQQQNDSVTSMVVDSEADQRITQIV